MGDAETVDLFIVGGGINGVGIARDAAGRGLAVALCEQGDLASATSSASSKLIHGGLRYLEYYEFRLVREALREREVLMALAPHIIWPLTFVLPHDRTQRPAWMIRIGLFLYDRLARRRRLPASRGIRFAGRVEGAPLAARFRRGFTYADCWVDDARLVVLNARDAEARGARVMTRTKCVRAERTREGWEIGLEDAVTGAPRTMRARVLVNAAGPWVGRFLREALGQEQPAPLKLVKGSHVVVPRRYEGDHAYIFQNGDGRIVFALPYEHDYTLIGTTDDAFDGDPADARATEAEIDYLLDLANRSFARPLGRGDVVRSFAGVRPLYDDKARNPSAVTRDYVFDVEAPGGQAPLLSIFGGKLTTYRRLAEHALDRLRPFLPAMGQPWTKGPPLPGGDLPGGDFERFAARLAAEHAYLAPETTRRLARLYGSEALRLLEGARATSDLGRRLGADLYERELRFLIACEYARTAEDVLWRRTKLGLRLTPAEVTEVERWMRRNA